MGSEITEDAKCHEEIKKRIAMGKDAFMRRRELLRRGLDRNLKKRMIIDMERDTIWIRNMDDEERRHQKT